MAITCAFGVPREKDNGRRVLDLCAERGLCMHNRQFKHKSLHKYTRGDRGQDGVMIKKYDRSGVGKEFMLCYVQDVMAL